ncbi:MAG: hypothetical protein Q8M31_21930 [Beijerinckiaceae bacterium]|nr:hypothetical protein [Beijerinckiaceae bacterium]
MRLIELVLVADSSMRAVVSVHETAVHLRSAKAVEHETTLHFGDRAPPEKVRAFATAFNDLQSAIQDVEGAGRD